MNSHAKIPAHVAIIMDGNGRWAASRGMDRTRGHARGADSVRACIVAAITAGVRYVTFYAFSTENWGRPAGEVDSLMELLCDSVVRETPELIERGVRVVAIGDREGLPEKVRRHIDRIEGDTASGSKLTIVLAVNYSSRNEIARAAARIATKITTGELSPENVTEETLSAELFTASIPDPDLLIRTGGECRLSNFLLWQSAYAELYFTPVMWPDFGEREFAAALEEYAGRERRFGNIQPTQNN
ncbi:MAG: di-trans,poly-cis-decaprenylcistransferase [Alistipes sp.]|jgi:undecaprenyl diphosphate synthase|nr:di-trans,poly-cis-decaprenylcistransferase [Alistipes sp.]